MKRILARSLAALLLLAGGAALSACHVVHGAGHDLSNAGTAVERAAH